MVALRVLVAEAAAEAAAAKAVTIAIAATATSVFVASYVAFFATCETSLRCGFAVSYYQSIKYRM